MVGTETRVGRQEGDIAQAVREGRLEKSEGVQMIEDIRRSRSTSGAAKVARVHAETKRQAELARQKALVEKMRLEGKLRLAKQARQKAYLDKIKKVLTARQEIKKLAEARGRGLTRLEVQRQLQRKGTSITELRKATRDARDIFKRTGFNIYKEIRKPEIKVPKKVTFKLPKDSDKKIILSSDIQKMIENDKLSSAINYAQSTKQINATIKNDIQLGRVSAFLLDVADIVSGGFFTEKKINTDQSELNNRIIKFNDKYNGAELSENQYNKAQAEQKFIETQQTQINRRIDNLVASKKNNVRNFYQSLSIQKDPRLTIQQQQDVVKARNENIKIQNQIKKNQPTINNKTNQVKIKNKEIIALQTKNNKTDLEEIKLFKLKNEINTLQTGIARLKFELPPKILAGTMPIILASAIPSGISQVRFIGAQKVGKGGKIITDLVFKTNKGIMGVARGASTTVKGNIVSIVGGRFGRVTANLLKGGRKFTKIKSFVGLEKGIVKGTKFTLDKLKIISKFIQNSKKSGLLRVIKTNIQGLQQAGVGRIATIKGHKFFRPFIRFPSGRLGTRLGRGIDLDDFASVSAILTKGDISAIIGKTITLKGRRAEFMGIIKSLSGGSSNIILSTVDKQQYSQALQKLFTSVAAAVSRAERSGRFATKSLVLAGAAASLSRTIPTVSSIKSAKTTLVRKNVTSTKQVIIPKKVKIKITAQRSRSLILQKKKTLAKQKTLQKQINLQKTRVKQLSRSKSKLAQKQISNARQIQRQLQKQLQKQMLRLKQIQVSKLRGTYIYPTHGVPLTPKFIFPFKLPKGFSVRKLSKKQPVYYVVTRKRGKMVKLYAKPLTLKDSRDYLAWSVDNNLTRSAWFVPLGKASKVVRPPKSISGYFSKVSRKLRPYKIRYGKRRQLLNGYIEKRKYFQDTKGERSQMGRLRKPSKIIRRTTPKRKISPQRRRQLIKQLQRARMARSGVKNRLPIRRNVPRRRVKRKISPAQRRILIKRLIKARAAKRRK